LTARVTPVGEHVERKLGVGGDALAVITGGVNVEEAARRRTRIRALLAAVAGVAVWPETGGPPA
jgi:hypothetical protein